MTQNDLPGVDTQPQSPYSVPASGSTPPPMQYVPGQSFGPHPVGPGMPMHNGPKRNNVPALVAIVLALLGTGLSFVDSMAVVGGVLLTAALILAIVALCLKNRTVWTAVVALVLSLLGGLTNFGVTLYNNRDAFSEVVTQITEGVEQGMYELGDPAKEGQTRTFPFSIDYGVVSESWEFYVDGVDFESSGVVGSGGVLPALSDSNNTYIVVYPYLVYVGAEASGRVPELTVKYVTPDGDLIAPSVPLETADDLFDWNTPVTADVPEDGALFFEVPKATATEGTIAIMAEPDMYPAFIAVQ